MASYSLTNAAAEDFETIFDFGIDTFGLAQALLYQNGLKQRFEELSHQPELFPAVDHLRKGYRRSPYGSHAIYYRIEKSGVVIVRILGQQNLGKAF
jgi:toxin ParE1/3/4